MPSFIVPPSDSDEFYGLPIPTQQLVNMRLAILARVHAAPSKARVRQMHIEADRMEGRGTSWRTLRKQYYDYRNTGDWRVLYNHSKVRTRKITDRLHPDFISFFRGLCDNHKRAINSAIDELYARWYAGDEIPAYGTWREWWGHQPEYRMRPLPASCPSDLPPGWSRSNLRTYRPHDAQLALVRRGIAAAMETIPTCISTRDGLRPFEYIVFDDAETDFLVADPVSGQVVKLEGIFGKDVATDVWLWFGLRLGIKRDDGTRQSLLQQDTLEVVCNIGTHYGYPRDYTCTLIVERGTATITPEMEQALNDATGGRVRVSRTGMIEGQVLCDGYADARVGNFRGKGWIESGFNLLWNKLDHVRGQKGAVYSRKPMELETRTKAAVDILRAGKLLPADVMLSEHLPYQDLRESFESINDALKRINSRTEHKCEGFQKITVWRFRDLGVTEWQPMEKLLALPAAVRDQVEVAQRMESPYERMDRLMREFGVVLDPLHPGGVAHILGNYHRKVSVRKGEIAIQIDGKTYRYFDPDSHLCATDGVEYSAVLPKGTYDTVYLVEGDGDSRRFAGTLPRRIAPKYGDIEGRNRQLAQKRKTLAKHVRAIRDRHADDIESAIAATDSQVEIYGRLDGAMLEAATPTVGGNDSAAIVAAISGASSDRKAALSEADDKAALQAERARKASQALIQNT